MCIRLFKNITIESKRKRRMQIFAEEEAINV